MAEASRHDRIGARWPVALTIVAVVLLLAVLPGRVQLVPDWFVGLLGLFVIAPIAGASLTSGRSLWLRLERWSTLIFFLIAAGGMLVNLGLLVRAMARGAPDLTGIRLLTSSIAIWITNVLAFSLLYWQLDRGGPESRRNGDGVRPDWQFPQEGVPELVALRWRPMFVDYLFLGFSTATAFSATAAQPLTSRAMLLMMAESSISLVTIVVVAARSINILGG